MTKGRNPVKIMVIVLVILVIALLMVVLFKKDKIVLENEDGSQSTGYAGKIGVKNAQTEEE